VSIYKVPYGLTGPYRLKTALFLIFAPEIERPILRDCKEAYSSRAISCTQPHVFTCLSLSLYLVIYIYLLASVFKMATCRSVMDGGRKLPFTSRSKWRVSFDSFASVPTADHHRSVQTQAFQNVT
jgi:hypothetical protein